MFSKIANKLSTIDAAWLAIVLFELFPLIIPDGLKDLTPLLYLVVYKWWRLASSLAIAVHFIKVCIVRKKVSSYCIVVLVFAFIIVLRSLFSGCSINDIIAVAAPCLLAAFLIEIYLGEIDRICLVLLGLLEFWLYLNFISIVLFPDGLYSSETIAHYTKNWILGYKSSLQYYALPAACISVINTIYRGQRSRCAVLIAACCVEAYLVKNMMLLSVLIVFIAILVFRFANITKVFNALSYSVICFIANILALFALSWVTQLGFIKAILRAMHKSSDLSDRASIWSTTIDSISNNWLIGYGILPSSERVDMYDGMNAAVHSHNMILEVLFIGGAVLTVVFILLNFSVIKSLYLHRDITTAKVLAVSYFALNLAVIVEVYFRNIAVPIWIMLCLGYWCKKVDTQFRSRNDCILKVPKHAKPMS